MQTPATSISSRDSSRSQFVPLLDIAPLRQGSATDRQHLAQQFDWACRNVGFVIITGHTISPDLIERMQQVTRAFFNLSLEEKLKCQVVEKTGIGYTPNEALTLAKTYGDALPPDLNETINMAPVTKSDTPYYQAEMGQQFFPDNRWPESPEEFCLVWTEYYQAASDLAANLMRICALALHLPEDYFVDKFDRQISHLVARNYPEQLKPPRPGQLRAAAHQDFGGLTLLLPEDKPGGLQVMGKKGQWHDVRPPANSFVVNLGDMMAQWTNDAWVSTLHRVVNPPQQAGVETRRLSIAFFSTPNYDTVIECLPTCKEPDQRARYTPVTAGAWYEQKLKQLGLTK